MFHNGAQLVYVLIVCGFCLCVLIYQDVNMYIQYVYIVSMSECTHLRFIKVASVIHHISG